MRILCDVDGVFANFTGHTLTVLGELAPEGGEQAITSWQILDHFSESTREICLKIWKDSGWCASIPPYPEALGAYQKLSTIGKVVWVTAPLKGAPHWHLERLEWLETHFGASEEDVVFTHDKSHVWGDVLIDDKLENVESWAETHKQGLGILWDRPYNRARTPAGTKRVHSWWEVYDHLSTIKMRKALFPSRKP